LTNLPFDGHFLTGVHPLAKDHRAIGAITELAQGQVPIHLALKNSQMKLLKDLYCQKNYGRLKLRV
jgi:hypothetical protein